MPEREYFIRGKRVTVEEIPGVVAVKLELSANEEVAARQREAALHALGGEVTVEMSETERNAFYQAGWVFVRQPPGGVGDIPGVVRTSHVGRVFRHPGGRTLIGSDRLAVKLKPNLSPTEAQALLRAGGLEVVRELRFAPNSYQVRVPSERDVLDLALELHGRDEFEYAEPEMIQHVGQRWRPNDPEYPKQWQWHNDGLSGGTPGADIGAEAAWDHSRGEQVRIAIIDTGFDVKHPDLTAAIGVRSGYFRDQGGADAVFVRGRKAFPDDPHGTFCAGMAAARANNSKGGCGVANRAKLMLVACLEDAIGTQATLSRAVAYATDPTMENDRANSTDGAAVIACSLGPNDGNWVLESVLEDALTFAVTNGRGGLGTPMFWAVGNDTLPIRTDEVCSHPATITVGRSNWWDKDDGSAYGPELDFLAPGARVYSTASGGGQQYGYATGTSFAAPCAAGIAALVLSRQPGLTWDEVRQVMRDTCDKVGGVSYGPKGRHDRYGYGRVSAANAVTRATGLPSPASSTVAAYP